MSKTMILAPISVGELLDKISILHIKIAHADHMQKSNCEQELHMLTSLVPELPDTIPPLQDQLLQVNQIIWNAEDAIRHKDRQQQFDDQFIQLATQIHTQNDLRAIIKRQINQLCNSLIVEEKVY